MGIHATYRVNRFVVCAAQREASGGVGFDGVDGNVAVAGFSRIPVHIHSVQQCARGRTEREREREIYVYTNIYTAQPVHKYITQYVILMRSDGGDGHSHTHTHNVCTAIVDRRRGWFSGNFY